MIRINSRAELESFLEENHWFEDGYITELNSEVLSDNKLSSVHIRIGYQIAGDYRAGNPRTVREFTIKACGIKLWTYDDKTCFNPEHCMQGIELLDDGMGIQFDIPEIVTLICEELIVNGPFDIESITKPWLSEREYIATIPGREVPLPEEWISWLQKEGFNVSWRFAGSEAKLPEKVSYPDYSGWFLQKTDKVKTTDFGVFFFHVEDKEGRLFLHIENKDSDVDLWFAITKIIAQMPRATILCGNCTFSGEQWIKYLADGTYTV
ncbi:hypothetical protein [Desulfitobacterium sp. PCE1]|uniref:hypothetical protein n=1 Tax=Desulfitobacterium sp. PCE1 TaxID=146907 RepID=UPI00035C4A64|nr:hypothetical protein [Desulfitobacterium sp. PCE1]